MRGARANLTQVERPHGPDISEEAKKLRKGQSRRIATCLNGTTIEQAAVGSQHQHNLPKVATGVKTIEQTNHMRLVRPLHDTPESEVFCVPSNNCSDEAGSLEAISQKVEQTARNSNNSLFLNVLCHLNSTTNLINYHQLIDSKQTGATKQLDAKSSLSTPCSSRIAKSQPIVHRKILLCNFSSISILSVLLLLLLLLLANNQQKGFKLLLINNNQQQQQSTTLAVEAYQLTNNIIANNLPPRFVAPGGSLIGNINPNGGGGGSSSASGSTSEIVVRVKEGNSSIGKLIYQLKADDPDDDTLTFGVLGSLAADLLRIENKPPNQANVYLRKELDRETTDSYQVIITLTDGKLGKGNWITKSMLIIVEDINDNYPVFGPYRTAISIAEDSRVPMVVETVEATDQDEGRFGQVIYRLEEIDNKDNTNGGQYSVSNMFTIDTQDGKGVISLINELDFEQKSLYQLRILAIDRAIENERLTATASILISVEDCEDQSPMFTFVPSISRIPENLPVGSSVVRVAAIDGDRGINNPIIYKLLDNNNIGQHGQQHKFQINAQTGVITVASPLDREQQQQSSSTLSAATTPTTNDEQQQQPGAYVLQVEASEDSASGTQAGVAPLSVTTELTILLTDVNDEIPTFNRHHYYGELLENSPPESLVNYIISPTGATGATTSQQSQTEQQSLLNQQQQVVAQVIDRDQGTNGSFYLYLQGDYSEYFDIWPHEATNEANFMIKVKSTSSQNQSNNNNSTLLKSEQFQANSLSNNNLGSLDFERIKLFQFTIVAKEKSHTTGNYLMARSDQQARSSEAQITVYLKDANDNFPQFDSALYRVEVPENAIRGMHICQVKATDLDSGIYGTAGIRYTEIRGEKANKFTLDPMTGFISLNTAEHGFDRETIGRHHLIVEARDYNGLGNRNTTQLLIIVADINDQAPKFLLDRYEARIYENELDFQSPLQVQAIDGDLAHSVNSRITYSIVAGDPHHNFTIDAHTGRIRVQSPLTENNNGGSSGNGSNGDDTVVGGGGGGLDFERIAQKRDETKQFNLTVRASDSGKPEPLHDHVQVIVLVYDKNDHAPTFSRAIYTKTIPEDIKEGTQVLQVQAQDGDHSPTNSKINYRIVSGGADKFVMDADTGIISIAFGANLDIDRETNKRTQYLLNVIALDGSFGHQQKSGSALVNITVSDVNNKSPEFLTLGGSNVATTPTTTARMLHHGSQTLQQQQQQQQQHSTIMSVYVNEDAPYGQLVTRVVALDLDSSANLRYSINWGQSEARNEDMIVIEPNYIKDMFFIEPMDGTIKVAKQLDRELCDQIKLRLQVEDIAAQTPNQVAHAYLVVRVTDVNDNRPNFKKPLYKAVVNENSIIGTSVATIMADDRDLNKTLKYTLDGQYEMTRLIRINTRTGEITVNDKIDRETHPMINVTIKAEDYGQPQSLTGSTQLFITVRDENDNNPVFVNVSRLPTTTTTTAHTNYYSRQSPSMAPPPPVTTTTALRRSSLGAHHQPALANVPPNHSSHHSLEPLINESVLLNNAAYNQDLAGASDSSNPPTTTTTTSASDTSNNAIGNAISYPSSGGLADTSHGSNGMLNSNNNNNNNKLQGVPFLAPNSNVTVSEDAPIGHRVAYVTAEDADTGFNARITYLLDGASVEGKFRIDRDSGLLTVSGALDREERQYYTFIVEACDNYDYGYSTGESRRAFAQFTILISDVNDNAPIILDTNTNTNNNNNNNSNNKQQQQQQQQSLSGMARDQPMIFSSGPTTSRTFATCTVISEFQPLNEPVMMITATDADDPQTLNGQIELSLIASSDSDLFGIVPLKQQQQPVISGNHLVSELELLAVAGTSDFKRSSGGTTNSDNNQNNPFESNIGSSLYTDTDLSPVGGGEADYVARSGGKQQSVSSANMMDEPGKLSNEQPQAVALLEVALGSEQPPRVGDRDEYGEATAIETRRFKRNALNDLSRQSQSSLLMLDNGNNRHNSNLIAASTVTSSGVPVANSNNHLLQEGRDNNYQQVLFNGKQQQQQQVASTNKLQISTTTTTATSSGPPTNQQGGPTSGEQQAQIIVTQSLKDRVGNYSLMVRASDRGQLSSLSSVKVINICVQDVNDHSPMFVQPPLNHTIRILENATIGTQVVQVEATDSDYGLNGQVQYSLRTTNTQYQDWQAFSIDRHSGQIVTNKLFNRQLKKYYTIRVEAQDLGQPTALSNDMDIQIMIVNSGDYQPEFDQQTQQVQFTENLEPGLEWFELSSTINLEDDPALLNAMGNIHPSEAPPPTQLSSSGGRRNLASVSSATVANTKFANKVSAPCYFIVDSDDTEQTFELDRYSHRLRATRALDRERKANYTLLIQATNNCNVPPSRITHVESPTTAPEATLLPLLPTGVNNNSDNNDDDSDSRSSKATRGSNPSLPASLALTIVGDGPIGGNRRSQYSTHNQQQHGSKLAVQMMNSGQHQTNNRTTNNNNNNLAEQLANTRHAQTNNGQDRLDSLLRLDKSLLKVVIKIKDINDNAPRFTQRIYTGGITTEADFGTVFMIVQASDADADQNSLVTYSIIKPIKRNLIMADNNNNNINQQQTSFIRYNANNHNNNNHDSPSIHASTALSLTSNNNTNTNNRFKQQQNADIPPKVMRTTNDNPKSSLSRRHEDESVLKSSSVLKQQQQQQSQDNNILADDDLFLINAQTGEISLNFDPQKHMKGYFEFEIMVNDTDGLFDSAKVFIYLLRQDQRVKFVLRLTPQELRQRLDKFRSVFGNITGAIVNVDSYKYYENNDGSVDKKKTSLYLHFVSPDDNTIIDVDKVLTLIDKNIEYLDELYKEFHVLSSEAAHLPLGSSALIDPEDQIRTGLLGVSTFLTLILILVIALCLNQRSRYKRQLKAATVAAFGNSPLNTDHYQSHNNLPNTNLHSQDPNPIWMNGYEQEWCKATDEVEYQSSSHSEGNEEAVTATPRDSLTSSQGRVSGSGSTSTTNEKHALCRGIAVVGRMTPQNISLPNNGAKQQQQQQQQQQQPQQQPQTPQQQQQQQHRESAPKVAPKPTNYDPIAISHNHHHHQQHHHHNNGKHSTFGCKDNHQQQVISTTNNQQQQQHFTGGDRQQHHVSKHQNHAHNNSKVVNTVIVNGGGGGKSHVNGIRNDLVHSSQTNNPHSAAAVARNYEKNLSRLSIINLETTEL